MAPKKKRQKELNLGACWGVWMSLTPHETLWDAVYGIRFGCGDQKAFGAVLLKVQLPSPDEFFLKLTENAYLGVFGRCLQSPKTPTVLGFSAMDRKGRPGSYPGWGERSLWSNARSRKYVPRGEDQALENFPLRKWVGSFHPLCAGQLLRHALTSLYTLNLLCDNCPKDKSRNQR